MLSAPLAESLQRSWPGPRTRRTVEWRVSLSGRSPVDLAISFCAIFKADGVLRPNVNTALLTTLEEVSRMPNGFTLLGVS